MKVAVTGATGFIGRELVRALIEKGDEVRILSRRPPAHVQFADRVSVHHGDLTKSDNRSLEAFVDGVDVLYHAAGQLTDESNMHLLHIEGTRRLLEASAGRIGRWVQLSSVGVYGPVRDGIVTEDTPLNPVGVYEWSKAESDELIEGYAGAAALEYVILRPSNVFGPEMTNQSLFQLINSIDRRLFLFIGRSGASANYIAVENVADALIRCGTMTQAKGRIYNLSDHRNLETFVAAIAHCLGVSCPRRRIPESTARQVARLFSKFSSMPLTESRVNTLVNRCVYSASRIEKELNYSHQVSMEKAIHNLVRRWKCHHGKRSAWWFRVLS